MNKVEMKTNKIMAAKDMTNSQIKQTNSQKILKYLQENKGEISNEEISRETGINKTNIPREIKKLENEGHKISKRYEQIGRSKFVWFILTNSQIKQTSSQKEKNKLPVQKIKKTEKSETIKENRGHREVISIEQMGQEVELFGRTIPLDKVREIARETLLGHRVMMEGVKSWLGVWKKRYHEYIIDKPEHFLIDKYEKSQETLEFIYKD
jgi:biotin operon repressor